MIDFDGKGFYARLKKGGGQHVWGYDFGVPYQRRRSGWCVPKRT